MDFKVSALNDLTARLAQLHGQVSRMSPAAREQLDHTHLSQEQRTSHHRALKVRLGFNQISRNISDCVLDTNTDVGCSTVYSTARRYLALPDRRALLLSNKYASFKRLLPQHAPLRQEVQLAAEYNSRFFESMKQTIVIDVGMTIHGDGGKRNADDDVDKDIYNRLYSTLETYIKNICALLLNKDLADLRISCRDS